MEALQEETDGFGIVVQTTRLIGCEVPAGSSCGPLAGLRQLGLEQR
jgi:hypothetical protein